MAATRVYILAKELGVKSTAIVKKCQEEGLDVKNHMAAISAGLAATIREWFSEGDNVTTVETTNKIDLKKVRIKKKKKRKPPVKKAKATETTKAKKRSKKSDAAVVATEEVAPTEVEQPPEVEPQPKEPEPILPAGDRKSVV